MIFKELGIDPEVGKRLKPRWGDKWVAVVDDDYSLADLVQAYFDLVVGEGAVTVQAHLSGERFLEYAHDYDVCLLDGNIGFEVMTGPEIVPYILARNPAMLIVGWTGEPDHIKEFRELEVALVIIKGDFTRDFPRLFGLADLWQ